MRTTITQVMWYLSGGQDPSVHEFIFPRKFGKIYDLKIAESTAYINCHDVTIPIAITKHESSITANRMAIEGIRPANRLVPFHMTLVPVKGMSIPAIKARVRMISVFPRFAINEINLEIGHIQSDIELLLEKLSVFVEEMWRAVTVTVPMLAISSDVDIHATAPDKIPGYFARINPTPITSMDRKELVLRRNGFADALFAPHDKIDILAVFKDVELSGYEHMEYDSRTRSLKLNPKNSKDYLMEKYDVIVGLDKRYNKVHIARYKGNVKK
ncbi:MAG: hypothetical protein ABIG42_08030 [bacterium]